MPRMLLMLVNALAAPCDSSSLSPQLDRAEQAFVDADPAALADAVRMVRSGLPCASPSQIARYYRTEALKAHLDDAPSKVRAALDASLAAHPLLPIPDRLLADPLLEQALHRAQERPLRFRSGPPRLVNGLRTPLVPVARHVGRSPRRGLVVAGLAMGAVTAGLYGAAWSSRKRFDRTDGQPAAERLPSYRATNRLSVATLTGAVAGSSLITLGLVL